MRAWLDAEAVAYRPFYLVNMLEVTGDAELAERLRRHPEIDRLVRNPLVADTHTMGRVPAKELASTRRSSSPGNNSLALRSRLYKG